MKIGFSTGCYFRHLDRKKSIKQIRKVTNTIEISYLKDPEFLDLSDMIKYAEDLGFEEISVHGPKVFHNIPDEIIIENLQKNVPPWMYITMHPDTIYKKRSLWSKELSTALCIENMDHRLPEFSKPESRKLREVLGPHNYPKFSFCFDIAHTAYIDPTMSDADKFLDFYKEAFLQQYHISEINIKGEHHTISDLNCELLKIPIYDLRKPFIIEAEINDTKLDTLKREYEKIENILKTSQGTEENDDSTSDSADDGPSAGKSGAANQPLRSE